MTVPPQHRPALGVLDLVEQAFPFYLRVDAGLLVRAFGRSLPRLCPGIAVGDRLTDHLRCAPPRSGIALADLREGPHAVLLKTLGTRAPMRCQVVRFSADDLLLLAAPWLPGPDELSRLGLVLQDFAAHDPSPDYAFLAQAQRTALQDARRLADRLSALEAARRQEALLDPLTGAGNRRCFAERLAAAAPDTSLVVVDLDHFKEINDAYGHGAGDSVLLAVAARLTAMATPADVVARIGGDEFAVVLSGDDAQARSRSVAVGIVDAMSDPVGHDGRLIIASVSVGVAPPGDPANLARNADVALYAAKQQGRDRPVVFDASLHEALLRRLQMRDRLRGAVEAGTVSVVYQPIVALATGRVHGFEALARWADPVLGPVPPDVFIRVAEEIGVIADVGLFVLETAVRRLAEWRRRHPGTQLTMSVNLAPRQLEDADLADRVTGVLAATGLPPDALQLELTESAFTTHRRHAQRLHGLRALGVGLAIDDFGSAESTLARLHTVPATTLKIDKAFLHGPEQSAERSRRLLRAVVALADALGLATVAEGIETEQHHDLVVGAGCTYGQGYRYARPMDAEAADAYLRDELAAARPRTSSGGHGRAAVPEPRDRCRTSSRRR